MSDEHEGGIGGAPVPEPDEVLERGPAGQRMVPRSSPERRSVPTTGEMRNLQVMGQQIDRIDQVLADHRSAIENLPTAAEIHLLKGRGDLIATLGHENEQLRAQLGQCERALHEHRQAIETLAARITAVGQQVVSRNVRYSAMDLAVKFKGPADRVEILAKNAAEILKFLEAGDRSPMQLDEAGWDTKPPEGAVSH